MRITRTAWLDSYAGDAECAVFVDDKVTVLSELATVLVDLVGEQGAELSAIAEGLAAAFGAPEGGLVEATRERVDELVAAGVLVVAETT